MLVDGAGELKIIDFELTGVKKRATSKFDASCVFISAYEAITKFDSSAHDTDPVQSIDNVQRWFEKATRDDWLIGEGVVMDVRPDDLKEVLLKWTESRDKRGYSWSAFISGASIPASLRVGAAKGKYNPHLDVSCSI
jgi:hypothetical protein